MMTMIGIEHRMATSESVMHANNIADTCRMECGQQSQLLFSCLHLIVIIISFYFISKMCIYGCVRVLQFVAVGLFLNAFN